jgi:lysophospholipase L1-like esterase
MFLRALLWGLCLPTLPLCWLQGWYFRRRTEVLTSPEDEPFGSSDSERSDTTLNILGLGDSVIQGVGLCSFADSVTARVSAGIAQLSQRSTHWRALGSPGAKARDIVEALQYEDVSSLDVAVISVGVNDVIGLTSLLQWQNAVFQIVSRLRARSSVKIIIVGLPPMHRFDRLPQPLRGVLGVRAQMLDLVLKRSLVGLPFAQHVPLDALDLKDGMARDGFHPSVAGHRAIAGFVVSSADQLLYQVDARD